ncbi:MAG TPA: TolC family protein [bacterium]|jgi:outer membrane protein
MRSKWLQMAVLCASAAIALGPAVSPAAAQAPPVLTVEQAVTTALDKHPSILTATKVVEAAEARVVQAKAGGAISVSINANASVGNLGPGGTPTGTDPKVSHSVSLDGSLPLYDGGILAQQVAQAEAGLQSAQFALTAAKQDVAVAAARAYFQALRAARVVEAREAALRAAQEQVRQAEALVRAGTAARADVLTAQAAAASAEVELIAAQGQVALTQASLRNTMGVPLVQAFALVDPGDPQPVSITPEQAATEAAAARAEVKRAAADVRASEAALRIAEIRAGVLINISAGASVQISPNPGQAGWSLGASASYPVADGGKAKAAVEEARANVAAARSRMDTTTQQVQLQAFQSALSVREFVARVRATQAALAAAEEAARAADGRYRAGVGTVLDVTVAQSNLVQARVGSVQTLYDLHQAIATLRHDLGQPVLARLTSAAGAMA